MAAPFELPDRVRHRDRAVGHVDAEDEHVADRPGRRGRVEPAAGAKRGVAEVEQRVGAAAGEPRERWADGGARRQDRRVLYPPTSCGCAAGGFASPM